MKHKNIKNKIKRENKNTEMKYIKWNNKDQISIKNRNGAIENERVYEI